MINYKVLSNVSFLVLANLATYLLQVLKLNGWCDLF
jgi:hypothetical protein